HGRHVVGSAIPHGDSVVIAFNFYPVPVNRCWLVQLVGDSDSRAHALSDDERRANGPDFLAHAFEEKSRSGGNVGSGGTLADEQVLPSANLEIFGFHELESGRRGDGYAH